MRKQRLPASLKSKIEFVMRGGRLDKRVKHRKKKTRCTCRIQPKFCNRSNEFKRPPKYVQKVLPFIYSHSTSVDKLTFISIAFLLPVLFRIEHENSCNDPIEIP